MITCLNCDSYRAMQNCKKMKKIRAGKYCLDVFDCYRNVKTEKEIINIEIDYLEKSLKALDSLDFIVIYGQIKDLQILKNKL